MRRSTVLATAVLSTLATSGTARAATPGPSVTKAGTTTLDGQALYFVSYDGLVNNNSFQKNGLFTYKGHQYAAWYTSTRNAVRFIDNRSSHCVPACVIALATSSVTTNGASSTRPRRCARPPS